MADDLGHSPTHGRRARGDPETSGSVAGSSRRSRSSDAGASRLAVDVGDRTREVADIAAAIEEARFLLTGRAIAQRGFIGDLSCCPSECEAASDHVDAPVVNEGFV